jgi:hypothetical protein
MPMNIEAAAPFKLTADMAAVLRCGSGVCYQVHPLAYRLPMHKTSYNFGVADVRAAGQVVLRRSTASCRPGFPVQLHQVRGQ